MAVPFEDARTADSAGVLTLGFFVWLCRRRDSADLRADLERAFRGEEDLRHLALYEDDLREGWPHLLRALAAGPLDGLAGLWCYNCGLGDERMDELIAALRRAPRLAHLNLARNGLSLPSAAKLAAWLKTEAPAGVECYLHANDWGDEGDALFEGMVDVVLDDDADGAPPAPKAEVGGTGGAVFHGELSATFVIEAVHADGRRASPPSRAWPASPVRSQSLLR